ncbi:SDR family oxidoreductase [Myxococcota bacterium]|nr:SDR family oxidoreductase [Myxococcota bacterium]
MSRILVTGANGFVGRALCPALAAAGHAPLAAVREASALAAPVGAEARRAPDLGPEADWREALRGVDVVVHLAARVHVMRDGSADPLAEFRRVNAAGTRRLAEQAAAAGVRRMVLASSVKVNGEATRGTPFRETDAPAPVDPYGVSKQEAEEALFEVAARGELEAVVLRPPLVYGPGVKGNFLTLLRLCRRALPLPLAAVENRRSLVYAGNLADALVRCATHEAAAGRTFLVRDGEDLSTPALIRAIAAAQGRPARLFPVPPPLLRRSAAVLGRSAVVSRLLDSLQVDDTALRSALGWTPPFTVERGIGETVRWFEGTG